MAVSACWTLVRHCMLMHCRTLAMHQLYGGWKSAWAGREGRAPCEKSRGHVRQGVRVCRGRTAIHRQAADRFVASVVPIASFVSSLAR